MKWSVFRISLGLCALLTGVGCGGGSSDCATDGNGSLTVTLSGLPPGANGKVHVTGPSTDTHLTGSQTLSVPAGTYAIAADITTVADPRVRFAFLGTPDNAAPKICKGATTTVAVQYAQIPTSNSLWWSNQNAATSLDGFTSAALSASSSPAATIPSTTPSSGSLAFDRLGNVWQVDGIAGSEGIERFPAGAFAAGGTKTPDIVVSTPLFRGGTPGPTYLAFDPAGNLWVSVNYASEVVRLDAAMLGASAEVSPSVIISGFSGPLAFDASGNLWIGAADHLVEFSAARLSASISGSPDVDLTVSDLAGGTLTNVLGLAFDASSNLFANFNSVIARLTPSERGSSGQATPTVELTLSVSALPEELAFDETGGLWLALYVGEFGRLDASQLTTSGNVTPSSIFSSADIAYAKSPAFFPAPVALPLYSAIP
jgi:streptogramin lyase